MKNADLNNNRYLSGTNGLLTLLMVIFILVCFPVKGQNKEKKKISQRQIILYGTISTQKKSQMTVNGLVTQNHTQLPIRFSCTREKPAGFISSPVRLKGNLLLITLYARQQGINCICSP
ncbi:hypothetical protein QQY79_21290 [Flavobacterium tructae]|uniref:hypothetical protein n=1 Tax=Flavobacterium tructae TaxID=1114873 RepID=UPI002551E450|nr:hypothetical protein [Flavobacterium tructae]MDL2145071.1 hypothetical protein [Flavobacterium tructae]